jgi:hypothetical protein
MTGVDTLTAYFTEIMLHHENSTDVKNTAFYQIMEDKIKESGAAGVPEDVPDDDYEQTVTSVQNCITQGAQKAVVDVLFGLATAKAVLISDAPQDAYPKLIKDLAGLFGSKNLKKHIDEQITNIEAAVREDEENGRKPESKEEKALRVIKHVDQGMLGITALIEILKRATEIVDYGHIAEVTLNTGRRRVKEELANS